MSLKSYSHNCLNDNWFEERAPPLKGVVADYGARSFGTTNNDSFKGEQSQVVGTTHATKMKVSALS